MKSRLTRNMHERRVAGVCSGLGRTFAIDPVIVRLVLVALVLITGPLAVVAYLLLWVLMPRDTTPATPPTAPPAPGVATPPLPTADEVMTGRFAQYARPDVGAAPANTGPTVRLTPDARNRTPASNAQHTHSERWHGLGVLLLVIGSMLLLDSLGVFMFVSAPAVLLLVLGGVVLLRNRR